MKKLLTTLATIAGLGCLAQTNLIKNPGFDLGPTNWIFNASYAFGINSVNGTPCAILGITNTCSVKQINLPFAPYGKTNCFGAWVGVAHDGAPNPNRGRYVTMSITRNYKPGVPSYSVSQTRWIVSDGLWHWMSVALPGQNTASTNCYVAIQGACVFVDEASFQIQ